MVTDPPPSSEPDLDPRGDDFSGMPRWVKVFGIIGLAVIAVIVILMLTGGDGGHGPGRH